MRRRAGLAAPPYEEEERSILGKGGAGKDDRRAGRGSVSGTMLGGSGMFGGGEPERLGDGVELTL